MASFWDDGSNIERVLKKQKMLCFDMYFQPFEKFRSQHYAGPAIMSPQHCINKPLDI
jgi:hypothetical protein